MRLATLTTLTGGGGSPNLLPAMIASSRVFILAMALAAHFAAQVRAQDADYGSSHGVLLLGNGEMIAGEITSAGDRFDVVRAGSELRVKASDVQVVAHDALECYQFLKAKLQSDRADAHLGLADWCLRHDLLEPARQEIEEARAGHASGQRIAALELRLELATREPEPGAAPQASSKQQTTTADLDRMVRGMPDGCVETFTNTIQPLLLNYCSTAGCHGPASQNSLRLLRTPSHKAGSRRSTQRNLHCVLSAIDRERPGDSPLLTMPLRPHGTAKAAIFTNREVAQYQQLYAWVNKVAHRKAPPGNHPASVEEPTSPTLLQTVGKPRHPKKAQATAERKAAAPTDKEVDSTPSDAAAFPEAGRNPETNVKRGATSTDQFVPRDPFDPEIFNRQYHGPPKS